MKRAQTITAIALTAVLGVGAISAPIAASANEQSDRNTALGLGVLAAGLLLTQHNKLPGILAAGGAAYEYSQYQKDVQSRHGWDQGGYAYDYGNRPQRPGDRYGQPGDHNSFQDKGHNDRQDNNRNNRDDNGNHRGGDNQRGGNR